MIGLQLAPPNDATASAVTTLLTVSSENVGAWSAIVAGEILAAPPTGKDAALDQNAASTPQDAGAPPDRGSETASARIDAP